MSRFKPSEARFPQALPAGFYSASTDNGDVYFKSDSQIFLRKFKVFDSFDRADNPVSLGDADSGQAWVADYGTWGIINNQAYLSNPAGQGVLHSVVVDAGTPDVLAKVKFAVGGVQQRFLLRYRDVGNNLYIQRTADGYSLNRRVGGTSTGGGATTIGTYTTTPADGDFIKVVLFGPKIEVYLNDNLIISVIEQTWQNMTKFGLSAVNDAASFRWDDFSVEEI